MTLTAANREQGEEALRRGQEEVRNREWERATRLLQKAVRLMPDNEQAKTLCKCFLEVFFFLLGTIAFCACVMDTFLHSLHVNAITY